MKELLTIADVAARAGRGISTIHRWVSEGKLVPSYRLARTNQVLFEPLLVEDALPGLLSIADNNPRRRGSNDR